MIAELFERDPLDLSKRDLDEIIAYMRAHRDNFLKKQKTAVKRKTAKTKGEGIEVEINL